MLIFPTILCGIVVNNRFFNKGSSTVDTLAISQTLERARAVRELQLQVGFRLVDGKTPLGCVFPVEFLDDAEWAALTPYSPQLIVSATRADILGVSANGGGMLDVGGMKYTDILALVTGTPDPTSPVRPLPTAPFAGSLVTLAKQAGLLPALIWLPGAPLMADGFALDIAALLSQPPIEVIRGETVLLPIEGAEQSTLTSFRTRYDGGVHLALVIGTLPTATPPLVRVHSSCVTGDLLGSMRCDCGGQLQLALAQIKEAASGILLYLHQEGRGIGISSKLRAYALQERGMDTFAANRQLGFEEDERDFAIACAILSAMGQSHIRLLTNNPDKLKAFDHAGIRVTERLPLHVHSTPHSEAYLEAKKIKRGHL